VGMLIPFGLIAYLPIFFLDFVASHGLASEAITMALSIDAPLVRFVLGIWWLIVWMGLFGAFTRNFLDVWILTNKRIVVIEQHTFFRREVLSLVLEQVQDVRSEVRGFFETIFGFGTIDVDSASPSGKNFKMDWASNPLQTRDEVMKHVSSMYKGSKHTDLGIL
jgi:hypothetical protein